MEVLLRVGEIRTIIYQKYSQKKEKLWEVCGERLLREGMEGRMLGKLDPERPCIGMLKELIKKDKKRTMKRRAEDRSAWRI